MPDCLSTVLRCVLIIIQFECVLSVLSCTNVMHFRVLLECGMPNIDYTECTIVSSMVRVMKYFKMLKVRLGLSSHLSLHTFLRGLEHETMY